MQRVLEARHPQKRRNKMADREGLLGEITGTVQDTVGTVGDTVQDTVGDVTDTL